MHFEYSKSHRRCTQGPEYATKSAASNVDNYSVSPTSAEDSSTSSTSIATLDSKAIRPTTTSNKVPPKAIEYTAGWICALPEELAAAKGILDEVFQTPKQGKRDENVYVVGLMANVKTVIVCLPYKGAGTTPATRAAEQVHQTFTALQYTLVVGVAGGIPSAEVDIRLGDVVVSIPSSDSPAVVQYDYGEELPNGVFKITSHFNQPPERLRNAISQLESQKHLQSSGGIPSIESSIARLQRISEENWSHPGIANDLLFKSTYVHADRYSICAKCDLNYLEYRPPRRSIQPQIHHGPIASANRVMRAGISRERVRIDTNALCLEMEAAGLMNMSPCLVIREICDYADSHKNKDWQRYAAATAAAYAKHLLSFMPKYSQMVGNQD